MIFNNRWACKSKPEEFNFDGLYTPEERYSNLYDIRVGPLVLADSRERVDQLMWMASYEEGKIFLYQTVGSTWGNRMLLHEPRAAVTDLALAFDALGQAVLFYALGSVLELWYFDSQAGQLKTKVITENGRTPLIDFDRKSNTSDATSDVALYYVENDSAYMRLQRDVYEIPYYTGVTQNKLRLLNSGMTVNNRFQITYTYTELYEGANEVFKVLESDRPLLTDIFGQDLEIRFRIDKPVTRCFLEAGLSKYYEKHFPNVGLPPADAYFINNHVIVCHNSGPDVAARDDSSSEIFSLFMTPVWTGERYTYERVTLLLKGGGISTAVDPESTNQPMGPNYYFATEIPYSLLEEPADYVLKLSLVEVVWANRFEKRKSSLIRNGVTIVEEVRNGERSFGYEKKFLQTFSRNRLRFGGFGTGSSLYGIHGFLYPATFTDISVKLNDRVLSWDSKLDFFENNDSTPSGTNLKYANLKSGKYTFFVRTPETYALISALRYEDQVAAIPEIMDYMKEAIRP